jgi:WD40 repeat protein
VIKEARDTTHWLSDAKYSPSAELLVFGASDGTILVYNVTDGYSLSATINQHKAAITSIDFSEDSKWIQSSCAAYELCFFEADTGMFIPAASRLRNTMWNTQNCPLGWSVQGIWPMQRDGTEVTACDSNLFRIGDGAVVVTGDSYGNVQLFRSPCVGAFVGSKRYRVSSNPITRLRFCQSDSILLTISGSDKVIVQWGHKRDRDPEVAYDVAARRGVDTAFGGEEDEDVARLLLLTQTRTDFDPADTDILLLSNVSKPWLATMVPPSKLSGIVIDPTAPKEKISKEHIFGLESNMSRSSVRFNRNGEFLYPTSKYVCIFNKKKNSQIFYEGHCVRSFIHRDAVDALSTTTAPDGLSSSDADAVVCCVCTSADGVIAASATQCDRPNIHVWDANSCVTLCLLQLIHRRGVVSMQFSSDRRRLVSLGMDQDYSIALWESPSSHWIDGRLLACCKGDPFPTLFVRFHSNSNTSEYVLVSGGKYHIKFWNLSGRYLNSSYPEFNAKEKIATLLCGTTSHDTFLTGSSTGIIMVWKGRKLLRSVRAHDSGVTCLWSDPVLGVLSAAKDGAVKQWSSGMKHIRTFTLSDADVPPINASIRSLDAVLLYTQGEASQLP